MNERLKFVAPLLDSEKMAVVCRDFGISRKTGYKLFNNRLPVLAMMIMVVVAAVSVAVAMIGRIHLHKVTKNVTLRE